MRLNHCRGVVTNDVIVKNPKRSATRGDKLCNNLNSGIADNRRKDGMTLYRADLRNRGS